MENKSKRPPVPKVGQILHFFDDGKSGDSRHYLAVVTHVLKPEQMKKLHWVPSDHDVYYDGEPPKDWLAIWEYNKKEYSWIFAEETDFFVGCAIPEYDDHILWFARVKDGSWFSMDAQSCWQGGFLDVTGEKYQRMVDDGYTYSERI